MAESDEEDIILEKETKDSGGHKNRLYVFHQRRANFARNEGKKLV